MEIKEGYHFVLVNSLNQYFVKGENVSIVKINNDTLYISNEEGIITTVNKEDFEYLITDDDLKDTMKNCIVSTLEFINCIENNKINGNNPFENSEELENLYREMFKRSMDLCKIIDEEEEDDIIFNDPMIIRN